MNTVWENIEDIVGKKIQKVHVALFVYKDKPSWNDSPIQLTFDDSSIILLEGNGNDNLKVSKSEWKEFIRENGKWSLFDVSDTHSFSQLVGMSIQDVTPIYNQFNILNGAKLHIGEAILNFLNVADSSHILWGYNNPKLMQWGCHIGNN